jgi:hypothetical protein
LLVLVFVLVLVLMFVCEKKKKKTGNRIKEKKEESREGEIRGGEDRRKEDSIHTVEFHFKFGFKICILIKLYSPLFSSTVHLKSCQCVRNRMLLVSYKYAARTLHLSMYVSFQFVN